MAEENLNPEPQVQEPQTPQLSPVEQRAMEQGWVPESDWQGDPADWRPAKEFVDRGELLKSISELRHENRRIREGVEEFRKHHEMVKANAYKQALADLRAKKKEALEEGDADKVVAIDESIDQVREQQRVAQATPVKQVEPAVPEEFTRWEARNSWYRADNRMKVVADEIARELVARGETNINKVLAAVDKEVREAFPAKFENPNRQRAGAVEGSTRTGRSSSKDEVVLTDAEKAVMNKIIRTGVITKEEYLKEYKARQGG